MEFSLKSLLLILLTLTAIFCIVYWGRPLLHRFTAGKTTAEVTTALRHQRPDLSALDAAQYSSLTLIGLKAERQLEVWGQLSDGERTLLKIYPFTGYSGTLGPKLREGDLQIPEGLYEIEYLNPNSRFHLSMKVSYPNDFDRAKGKADGRDKLGFDIFIHGKSSTVGCIPIGDRAIEELFTLVAKMGPENVRVILAPYDMRQRKRNIEVEGIDWEDELYQLIRSELVLYHLQ